MNTEIVLSEESYDVPSYNMTFRFRWIKDSDGFVHSVILEQPEYCESQDQGNEATERTIVNERYQINNCNKPRTLEEAKQQVDLWCRRTAHAIYKAYPNTLLESPQDLNEVPQNESIDDLANLDEICEQINNRPTIIDSQQISEALKQKVFGQPTAIEGISNIVSRQISREKPQRPAVIFATGPSGVGKTRTAMVLVNVLNNLLENEPTYQFLRLDMSEYQESYRVSQLIGSPQGYVGHGNNSEFVNKLRSNPKTIVLFDEIEKAHPDILRLLMNAIDAGRLSTATSENGNYQIDCREAIFIFTSNLDSSGILADIQAQNARDNFYLHDEISRKRLVAAGIPKEVIGRIGLFVAYQPMSVESRAQIILSIMKDIAAEFGMNITHIEPSVVSKVLNQKSSDNFGARMDRVRVEALISESIIIARKKGVISAKIADNPVRCIST